MAKYNREFLVPYLTNICALHLAKRELEFQLADYREELSVCKENINIKAPQKEEYDTPGCGTVLAILFGLFMTIVGIYAFIDSDGSKASSSGFIAFVYLFAIGFGIFVLACCVKYFKECNDHNKYVDEIYAEEYKIYQQELKELKKIRESRKERIPVVIEEINNRKKEIIRIENTLEKAYSANIIPTNYREIYAAIYLYDWFVTGSSDNLDMALNTYVLEEIKSRLDTIIRNQRRMILQQQIMIANQYKSMEQQKKHATLMEKKLNKLQNTIELSAEEHNKYHAMIESNTRAMAYFSAAQYFKN